MTIGILNIALLIHKSSSLKDKRIILNSLKARLRSHFNISLIESEDQNKWQKSGLAIVSIGQNRRSVNRTIDQIINFIGKENSCEILDYQIHLI